MRTVSFSSPAVQEQLNRDFVCVTSDITGRRLTGQSLKHRPSDPPGPCLRGNGAQNVQVLFLTPEGQVFHAIVGYIDGSDLLRELEFAKEIDAGFRQTRDDPREYLRSVHRQRLESEGRGRGAADPATEGLAAIGSFLPPFGGRGSDAAAFANPMLDLMTQGARFQGHQYCLRHPLQDWQQLDRDPAPLVGSGQTFFASMSSEAP